MQIPQSRNSQQYQRASSPKVQGIAGSYPQILARILYLQHNEHENQFNSKDLKACFKHVHSIFRRRTEDNLFYRIRPLKKGRLVHLQMRCSPLDNCYFYQTSPYISTYWLHEGA